MTASAEFRAAYAAHRAAEGRAYDRDALLALPYLARGPLARQWAVRARTYDAFVRCVLAPMLAGPRVAVSPYRPRMIDLAAPESSTASPYAHGGARGDAPRGRYGEVGTAIRFLDLGAGNAWLCARAARLGCECVALDLRDDAVDGLRAADAYLEEPHTRRFARVAASFDALPLAAATFDVVAFNASLHYATDLAAALREARRVVRAGGRVVVLDSPFYRRDADGRAMVDEKRRDAAARFGDAAGVLLGVPAVEYLTRHRLAAASAGLGLAWRRRRVLYPAWYELRPLAARLRGRRAPSRFDLWEGTVA